MKNGRITRQKNTLQKVFILSFFILLLTNFFNNRYLIENTNLASIRQFFGIIMSVFCVYILNKRYCLFGREFSFIIFSFFLCSISSYLLYNQSAYESIKSVSSYILALSMYILLHEFKLDNSKILGLLIVFSIIIVLIEFIQQFTYPNYWFCGRIEKGVTQTLEVRMGLYRFNIYGILIILLSLMMVYQKWTETHSAINKYSVIFVVLLMGIILGLERKIILTTISTLIIGPFVLKNRTSIIKIAIFVLLFIIAYILADYMESLNQKTLVEISDSNFVRYASMRYFLFDINNSPLYYLFGAGVPGNSQLGNLINQMEDIYGFYQSDIGIIGYVSKVGFVGLFPYILIVAKIIRFRKYVDEGLLLFLIALILICVFTFWGNYYPNITVFSIYLYLVERSIIINMRKLNNVKLIK